MPYGYLGAVCLFALLTGLALAPVRRPRTLGLASWILTLTINEIPFVVGIVLAISTIQTFAEGDVSSPGGWAVVAFAVLTAGGLAVVAHRGRLAAHTVESALRDGLGSDWRADVGPDAVRPFRARRPWRTAVLPFPFRPRSVVRVANLRYGDAGRRNLLDVYHSRSRPSGAPVLVYLHGGGYFSGEKHREGRPLLHRFASQGWVCVSANYRLRPAATFPDHLVDLKKVLAWVREHGHEYGADPATVFVAGSSAGAHLASIAALTPNEPELQPGFEDADTSITAAVGLYGYYGYYYGLGPADRPASSPLGYDATDAPPVFLAHGDQDTYTPVEGARELVRHLRAGSANPVVYAELRRAQHSFDLFRSARFEAVVDGVEAFAAWVLRTETGAGRTGRSLPAPRTK